MSLLARHRPGLVAAAVIALTGFGVTALAVAPLAPDAALLPQRLVTETVVPEGLDQQLLALADHDYALMRSEVTRSTDTPTSLFARLGVTDPRAASFIRTDPTARLLLAGRSSKMVQARTDSDGMLLELVARYPSDRPELAQSHFTRLSLSRVGSLWVAVTQTVPYGAQARLASGTINNTLFAATDEARLPDVVASQLSEIFSTDIDFHRQLRRGDTFSVVYESLTADGEPVVWNEGAGRVLAAEFVTSGRTHEAVWFTGADGKGAYFDADGRSRRRTFLASPLEFSRVTSGFAMRFHPLMQDWRAHMGVDYGAPVGTSVRVVASGTVTLAGRQNGYGNVVQVEHGNNRSTLYAHLSRIDVHRGQHVDQGQRLGSVGMTGWATGPHLHFEFRVNGQHQDPLSLAKAAETIAMEAGAKPRFAQLVTAIQAKLDAAASLGGASRASFE